MNLHDVLIMGGYGNYVWAAYGITLFVFSYNLITSYFENKKIKKIVKEYLKKAK